MSTLNQIYIDGAFVTPNGTEQFDLHNPATGEVIGQLQLGDEVDTDRAVAAAKRAFETFSQTSKEERIALLHRLHDAVAARKDAILAAVVEEYGAPRARSAWMADSAAGVFLDAARTLEEFDFTRQIGNARVTMQPLGVVGIITPWNSNVGFICSKLAMVVSSGSTCVIKPSEMSGHQTQVIMEALHDAGLPAGVCNIVNGLGSTVGARLSSHPDVAKISFTGSTGTGRAILRAASETFKRVTLELGGKSPMIVLDDADFEAAMPFILGSGYMNSGQACIAATRILVPKARMAEFERVLSNAVAAIKSGDPLDPATAIGPMVSERQWERVQSYIELGVEEGATLLAGGPGLPEGETRGWFVRPTVFTNVTNDMRIAREEVFGPVLVIIPYDDEDAAVSIANDTEYGLHAYVASANPDNARKVADRIVAGRVVINGAPMEPLAPFGGFKHSGIGRENGVYGLESYMEPKAVMT